MAFVLTGVLLALGLVGMLAGLPVLSGPGRIVVDAILLLSPLGTTLCGVFTLERIIPHAAGFLLGMASPAVGFLALGWCLITMSDRSLRDAEVAFAQVCGAEGSTARAGGTIPGSNRPEIVSRETRNPPHSAACRLPPHPSRSPCRRCGSGASIRRPPAAAWAWRA
ncbi:hypothetical protein [Methylobacterium oryzihabitans]|uniref:Uncharacterized protein n=1 Tax=Methylobacterium oryzihabitans TaxID=2499852 RepID=A0A437NYW3_9HYPH|nr:hypothetical protein [Methylobacterium oryzihabitans]RVU15194.1 hypothetical protein EOE48_20510 [Methylobacterium oryzihabitans]